MAVTAPSSAAPPAATASTPSGSRSITARRAASCCRSSHDIDALRHRSPVAWMRLFDDRYKRTAWPYGSGVWGKKEWICPEIRDENVVSMDEGRHEHLLGRALRPRDRRRGSLGQAVRQLAHRIVQGSRHDGARLGRQADDRRRRGDPRRRLRVDRRHVGRARRLRRGRRHPRDRHPAARHGHAGAARAAARQRRAASSRSTPTSTAAWRSCSGSPTKRASTSPTR